MARFPGLWRAAVAMAALVFLGAPASRADEKPAGDANGALVVVVMDPLSAPLSCDCVKGYAQRKYEHLGAFLQKTLGRPVKVEWSESLVTALRDKTNGRADLVIGKYSVVADHAARSKRTLTPVASLTGKDGGVTQTGLVVVRTADAAKTAADLKGYRLFFGPADCDEKSGAVKTLLKKHGVPIPEKDEIFSACSESATALLELKADEKAAAVISSYAAPLLEGCGNVKKGDLRIIAESEPLPFVTAFVDASLPESQRTALTEALLDVGTVGPLLIHLETRDGFIPYKPVLPKKAEVKKVEAPRADLPKSDAPKATAPKTGDKTGATSGKSDSAESLSDWPGWRGPRRDGIVARLPSSLPVEARFEWRTALGSEGMGGLAVADGIVVAGARDVLDQSDVFHGLDAKTGERRWILAYPAAGAKLDYGNSPRATPLIHGSKAYLFGAFGHLHCVDLKTGETHWKVWLAEKCGTRPQTWGLVGSPLLVDALTAERNEGRIILQAGGTRAGLVALDSETGETVWESEGHAPGHASPVAMTVGNRTQIIAYDQKALGGWDAATGKRIWTLTPPVAGDFNVPTPVPMGDRLFVVTENNGARLYAFDDAGKIITEPVAHSQALLHDTHSPVAVGGLVFGLSNGLKCLDARDGLKPCGTIKDRSFRGHGSLIASNDRLLTLTFKGELILIDAGRTVSKSGEPKIIGRLPLGEDLTDVYAHPALAGDRLYVRLGHDIACLSLP